MEASGSAWIPCCEDLLITSNATGTMRQLVLTPQRYWNAGQNLAEVVACLRIANLSAGGAVLLKAQYSFDGKKWKTSTTLVLAEKTADDDYVGVFNVNTEVLPWWRIVVEIRDQGAAAQKTALVSLWQYMKYRT